MYAPPAFRTDDADEVVRFMAARRFGLMVVGGDEPAIAWLPLLVRRNADGALTLEGHLARANPMVEAAQRGGRAVAAFQGPDAYVTPGLYPSKREHGKVVPTWNYIAAEARGTIETFEDAGALRDQLDRLTETMEAGGDAPWSVADAPKDYLERMLRGIVGVRLRVDAVEGVRKLSQNKSEADRNGVLAGFAKSIDPGAQALAHEMTKAAHR
jgi:transcriptional regulator